jgi:hypothetical protein
MIDPDATLCPLCGEPNACALAAGQRHCWCFEVEVSEAARVRAAKLVGERVCVCRRCGTAPAAAQRLADAADLLKKR